MGEQLQYRLRFTIQAVRPSRKALLHTAGPGRSKLETCEVFPGAPSALLFLGSGGDGRAWVDGNGHCWHIQQGFCGAVDCYFCIHCRRWFL